MARVPYADREQLSELIRQSGFPGGVPYQTPSARSPMRPRLAPPALRLVLALLTEMALDPKNVAWPASSLGEGLRNSRVEVEYENAT